LSAAAKLAANGKASVAMLALAFFAPLTPAALGLGRLRLAPFLTGREWLTARLGDFEAQVAFQKLAVGIARQRFVPERDGVRHFVVGE
jgi:hypothetical protein